MMILNLVIMNMGYLFTYLDHLYFLAVVFYKVFSIEVFHFFCLFLNILFFNAFII